MRYLKIYEDFSENIITIVDDNMEIDNKISQAIVFCERYNINNYSVNGDGTVDVDGSVDISDRKGLGRIPIKFRNVTGSFNCYCSDLTTLEGCPTTVGGLFTCHNNKLTSLKGCPSTVGGFFDCRSNSLISLEGCPTNIIGTFDCSDNGLISLKGGPITVGGGFNCCNNIINNLDGAPKSVGYFNCTNNRLTSFEGFPDSIRNWMDVSHNPVYELWKLFDDINKIELFNDYDIVRGNTIVLDRLNSFLQAIGRDKKPVAYQQYPVYSVKGYTTI